MVSCTDPFSRTHHNSRSFSTRGVGHKVDNQEKIPSPELMSKKPHFYLGIIKYLLHSKHISFREDTDLFSYICSLHSYRKKRKGKSKEKKHSKEKKLNKTITSLFGRERFLGNVRCFSNFDIPSSALCLLLYRSLKSTSSHCIIASDVVTFGISIFT